MFDDGWPETLDEAREVQQKLRGEVVLDDDLPDPITTVAGVDTGFEQNGEVARAAVVLLSFPGLALLDQHIARREARFPYVPGYLSFREAPAVLAALASLKKRPDLVICDGQGIAHPRRLGIASHVGLLADLPTIGCAKSRLWGKHDEVPDQRFAHVPLVSGKDTLGAVLRTRPGVKPLYVSPGHRVSVETAVKMVIACAGRYRLPEPTRLADAVASRRGALPDEPLGPLSRRGLSR